MQERITKNRCGKLRWILPVVALLVMISGCAKQTSDTEPDTTAPAEQSTEVQAAVEPTAPPELEFPYLLEGGALEVSSAFQYSGPNPDCQWEEEEDLGALALVNRSERYLEKAKITVILSNEATLQFNVYDIPAGQTVWAFESENQKYPVEEHCIAMECEAQFADDLRLSADEVSTEAAGTTITLTNNTDKDMQNLTVRCHILFDEVYFGGSSYSYPVENIPAGGNATVEAMDCFLGDAAVVWVG